MGNILSPVQIFVAEAVERFPVLYAANHIEQLNGHTVRTAYREIARLARIAGHEGETEHTIEAQFRTLKKKYWYVQWRFHDNHALAGMRSSSLQTMIVCHYLLDNTFHVDFVNVDLRDFAAIILAARIGWVYMAGQAVEPVIDLLPPVPGVIVIEQGQEHELIVIDNDDDPDVIIVNVVAEPEVIDMGDDNVAEMILVPEEEDELEVMVIDDDNGAAIILIPDENDGAEVIVIDDDDGPEVIVLANDDDEMEVLDDEDNVPGIPNPAANQYPLAQRRAGDYADEIVLVANCLCGCGRVY